MGLPVRNLVRISLLMALVISALIFVFLIQDKREEHVLLYTIMTAIIVGSIGLADVGITIVLHRRFQTSSKRFRLLRYLCSYLFSLLAYLSLWPVFAHLSGKVWSYGDVHLLTTFIISSALINSLFLMVQDIILLQKEKNDTDLELSKLKSAQMEAANLLLKQQIHPHFLFNALNTLKALYRRDLRQGDTYMVHLADFLRASISNHTAKISSLETELNLLIDYLEMQKIRFGFALHCTIEVPEESRKSCYLPSFSLQPLLENAIKHNELTEAAPLSVHIYQEEDRIVISNNLQKKMAGDLSTHHGLANLAERYRLWSGDEVFITEAQDLFSVSLKLLKHEHSHH